jgi:hypothetical protein
MASPDRLMIEELRGQLDPDYPVWWLAWDRIETYVRQAITAQPLATQFAIYSQTLAAAKALDYHVEPFKLDANGTPFLSVYLAGHLLLELSIDRLDPEKPLMPLDPLRIDEGN